MTAADCTLDLFDCSCPTCSELWTETINAAQAAHKETEMMTYRPAKRAHASGNMTPLKERAETLAGAYRLALARNRQTPGQATHVAAYRGWKRVETWTLTEAALVVGAARKSQEEFQAKVYEAAIAKLTWARLDSKLQAGFYAVLDGTLLWAPMLADGSIDLEDDGQVNAGEVSCIETQAELDEINALLGTAYLMAGFPGR